MTSEPKPDPFLTPQHDDAQLMPHEVPLDPRAETGTCSDGAAKSGSDPCSGAGGKADGKGV